VVFVCNFTPETRSPYNVGVPSPGPWREILNSDHSDFGGSGVTNQGTIWAAEGNCQGRNQHVTLTLPPLGVCVLEPGEAARG
jgi:1,4-alpha-glucan branching enzyme